MGEESRTINEVDFCGRVASWINQLLTDGDSPFAMAAIEGYGTGSQARKRKDLRLYDHDRRPVLTGEVRLPGSRDGDRFSVITGTVFQDTKRPQRDWFTVAFLTLNARKEISSLNVQLIMGFKKRPLGMPSHPSSNAR
jgi:hypothetical protein